MKIIDLLNKIANYEGAPNRIKYNEKIYEYVEEIKWYLRDDMKSELTNDKKCLNDEVEIAEEDKPIEKIVYDIEEDKFSTYINGRFEWVDIPENYRDIIDFYKNKINELIDEINKLKEKNNE